MKKNYIPESNEILFSTPLVAAHKKVELVFNLPEPEIYPSFVYFLVIEE